MKSILTVRGKTLNYKPQQIWFTGIHLCTSEFRSFTVLISNAHPYHEYCLHQAYLPFLPRTSVLIKEDCGRKLCHLVLQLLSQVLGITGQGSFISSSICLRAFPLPGLFFQPETTFLIPEMLFFGSPI